MLETIYTRRSIRHFNDKKVPEEDLEKIIEAGLRAPSAKNEEPWFIVAITDTKKDAVCEWILKNEFGLKTSPDNSMDTTKASVEIIQNAPVLLLIFNRSTFIGGRKKLENAVSKGDYEKIATYEKEMLGIGACMQNILLAAHSLGLGAVALGDIYPAEPMIKKTFKIKYDLSIGIAIGYPAYEPGKRIIDKKEKCSII